MSNSNSPARHLQGLTLDGGWVVTAPIARKPGSSGGFFSESYLVENAGRKGFLKALDFSGAFEPGKDTLRMLNIMTAAFEHERDVLGVCAALRLSNVVTAIGHGDVQVPGFDNMSGRVFYLIFELADGDVRRQVDQTRRFDTYWGLLACKDVCLGLWQVHRQMIAHQDMKPSNVLIYGQKGFRIADFGRSSQKGKPVSHDQFDVAGDKTYSPPELLYGFAHPDFNARRLGCDMYMLGNLITFMLTGANVTSGVLSRVDPQFRPDSWQGSYQQVLPYIQRSYSDLLADIGSEIDPVIRVQVLSIIEELCNPDLFRRGHPKSVGKADQYSLERYVSTLDLICRRYQIQASARSLPA